MAESEREEKKTEQIKEMGSINLNEIRTGTESSC